MRVRMTIMAGLATLAGSVGLYPLFESGRWFWAGFGAVLAVAGGGLLARRFRLPAVVNPLAGLAALLVYLTAVYAPAESLLWLVPTPSSVEHLRALADEGWDAANRYAAPVPLVPGIGLLVAAGVGLVAVLVDLLAVRLRRAAPAGLPLLAMYSVPAAVRDDGVSWMAFGVGALGFLALLMSDAREQVGGWGRMVSTRRWSAEVPMAGTAPEPGGPAARPDGGALAASGRRIGVGAVAVAVLLPMAVPGIHPRGLFGMGGTGGRGTQTVTTPDPLVSLKRELTRVDDSVVLTYRTDDPAGPDYLRMYALDKFDGDRWTYSEMSSKARRDRLADRPIPAPPGLDGAPVHEVTTRIEVKPRVRNMTFLPVPYAPSQVSISGDWRVHAPSLMVYSLNDSAGGRSYTVRSLRAQPTPAELASAGYYPDDILSRYIDVPKNIPPEVRRLSQEITAGASSAYAQAVRLQSWFSLSGGFTYDLSAPAPQHGSELVDFLLHSKRGYCEQFAAAMALMARILGIPARVAMGYTPGTQTGSDQWVVRSRDAHAWPELYFEGAGWVRFEPTPSGSAGQGTASTPSYSQPSVAENGSGSEAASPSPSASSPTDPASASASAGPRHRTDDTGPEGTSTTEEQDQGGFSLTPWLAGGLLVALLLAAPMVLRAQSRRRRWALLMPSSSPPPEPSRVSAPDAPSGSPRPGGSSRGWTPDPAGAAHAAWREMRDDARDHGLEWRSSDSPRATARRLGELLELDGAGTEALRRIARAEELARYSRSVPSEPPERLRADVRTVRESFSAAVSRRARWRARLLPPSTLAEAADALRAAGTRTSELTGALGARVNDLAGRINDLPTRMRRRH